MLRLPSRWPRPLVALLLIATVEALAWSIAVPALQGPDESAHFAYVQRIVDAHEIPWPTNGPFLSAEFAPSVSSEQRTAWTWAGLEPLRGNNAAVPLWTSADEAIYRAHAREPRNRVRTDGGGVASYKNPPAAYLYASVPYALALHAPYFDRLFVMRWANIPLLLLTVLFTWLLAGEVFERSRARQTLATAVVVLQPVLIDTLTKVSPDPLLVAATTAGFWCCARLVRLGAHRQTLLPLAATCALAALTQGRGLALLLPALAALLVGWKRPLRASRSTTIGSLAVGALTGLMALLLFAARGSLAGAGRFLSYLWQFYLPALPGMQRPIGPVWGAEQVYVERFFARFEQFEVGLPVGTLHLLHAALALGGVLLLASLIRHRSAVTQRWRLAVVLVVALAGSMLVLHAAAYRSLLQNPIDPIITGRYLLPFVSIYGIAVATAASALPRRLEALAAGLIVAGACALQFSALGHVVERFYA